ncbi:MAG: sigma-54 dependent transcriptional regulator [Gemmatimonadota bacterium]
MNGTVLVSTHSLPVAGQLRDAFRKEGYAVELVTPGESLAAIEQPVLLVLTGDGGGATAQALAEQARNTLDIPIFGIAGGADSGAEARLARAWGFTEIFPPDTDPAEIGLLGRRLVERRRLQAVTGIVGETEPMREALERVVQIAPVQSTVLVSGESGTGKELVARGIHALSPRRHRAFMAINVAAIPDTLLESELFGHEKGAFTGAIDARKGFFELAHRGTLFLDEIGEMPYATQTKLLRVLEQREFLRVGGETPLKVDVRIVAATNQDLRQLVQDKTFRRDLYYRVNVLSIELPPLRERRDDIPRLVNAFVREVTAQLGRPFPGISDDAMEVLKNHRWPGNVRELRNLVESMVVLAPGREIRPDDLPREIRSPAPGTSLLPVPADGGRSVRPGTALRAPAPKEGGEAAALRPELEFIFRTLVELRVDMDQLQREFTAYREDLKEVQDVTRPMHGMPWASIREARISEHGSSVPSRDAQPAGEAHPSHDSREDRDRNAGGEAGAGDASGGKDEEETVLFRPGMTMEELEKEAIVAVLRQTNGNRRKAAELLDIGERTLYRKIRRFELDA